MPIKICTILFCLIIRVPCQAVLLVDRGDTVALSNGFVSGEIEKSTGRMLFLNRDRSPNLVGQY